MYLLINGRNSKKCFLNMNWIISNIDIHCRNNFFKWHNVDLIILLIVWLIWLKFKYSYNNIVISTYYWSHFLYCLFFFQDGIPSSIRLKYPKPLTCCFYVSKFGNLSSGHRTGKGQFSFQSQIKVMPSVLKLLHNCTHLTC